MEKSLLCYALFAIIMKTQIKANFVYEQCDPAEEGISHTLQFSWNSDNITNEIFVFHRQNIASCTLNMRCNDFIINKTKTKYVSNLTQKDVTLKVHVFNTSRLDLFVSDGVWKIKNQCNGDVLLSCNLTVFFRAQEINCSYDAIKDYFIIMCSTPKVYPQAKCNFLANIPGARIIPESNISYNSTRLQGDPVYFTTSCTAAIPASKLEPGYFYIDVTMYPDVTQRGEDTTYGLNKTFYVLLEPPSVQLKDCPRFTSNYDHGTCTCERNDSNFVDATVNWYNEHGIVTSTDTSDILSFNLKSNVTVFYCRAKNLFGWESKDVTFSTHVLSKFIIKNKRPPQLVDTLSNSTSLLLNFGQKHIITIILNISCYPKPQSYSIVKNHMERTDFKNVTDGNAEVDEFIIVYRDDVIPHGSLNLTFPVLKDDDFTNYKFIVDNGVRPPLVYEIFIERVNTTDETYFVRIFLFSSLIFIGLFILIGAIKIYRMKAKANTTPVYEEAVYEDVHLILDGDSNTDNAHKDVAVTNTKRNTAGSSLYDVIDDTFVVEDSPSLRVNNTKTLTLDKYDNLDTETSEEKHKYDTFEEILVARNTKDRRGFYDSTSSNSKTNAGDTPIDETKYIFTDTMLGESKYLIILNDEVKDNTVKVSVDENIIPDYLEPIIVNDIGNSSKTE